jgi:acetylornithine/N-succinyldiaminopimelate aminotransferase
VQAKSERLAEGLSGLPGVTEVRGKGLLLAAELDRPAGAVVSTCLGRGLLVTTAGENVLRLTPPLTILPEELDMALGTLEEVLSEGGA